eukprot:6205094-Pleurochrysis_carterae.AAC.1
MDRTRSQLHGPYEDINAPCLPRWASIACMHSEDRHASHVYGLTMRTAHRKRGLCAKSLNTKGDEIWYLHTRHNAPCTTFRYLEYCHFLTILEGGLHACEL